jgi:uncharacterized protein YegL
MPRIAQSVQYISPRTRNLFEDGVYGLMRLSRHRDEYREAIFHLARQIIEAAESTPPPQINALDLGVLPSAFASEEPKHPARIEDPSFEIPRASCLPVYFVLDTSASMTAAGPELISALTDLITDLKSSPSATALLRTAVVSFNNEAQVVIDLRSIEDVPLPIPLQFQGATNYGHALSLIKQLIDADVARLRTDGLSILRPVVFFLTDGLPTDGAGLPPEGGWQAEFTHLTNPSWPTRPHVVAFGFGEADREVLAAVGTLAAYIGREGQDPRSTVTTVFNTLSNTLMASAESRHITMPEEIAGFSSIPLTHAE